MVDNIILVVFNALLMFIEMILFCMISMNFMSRQCTSYYFNV